MKTLITILLLITLTVASSQSKSLRDKYLHFGAGYVFSSMTSAFSHHVKINNSVSVGITTGAAAGLAKELRDQYVYQGFDIIDFVVTAQGSLFGGMCVKVVLVPQVERKKPIEF